MADLIAFNLETNSIVVSYDVTFVETAPCSHDVFECAGDKEIEESIFVDEKLQGFNRDEDEPLLPSTSSPELVPASTLEAEAPPATTSSTAIVDASRVEGEIISKLGAPYHIQKAHPLQHIIGNMNERVTWCLVFLCGHKNHPLQCSSLVDLSGFKMESNLFFQRSICPCSWHVHGGKLDSVGSLVFVEENTVSMFLFAGFLS
jgi:hypothetical protein